MTKEQWLENRWKLVDIGYVGLIYAEIYKNSTIPRVRIEESDKTKNNNEFYCEILYVGTQQIVYTIYPDGLSHSECAFWRGLDQPYSGVAGPWIQPLYAGTYGGDV